MKDDICTIPIRESFEQNDGCPLCHMRDHAEKRAVEYICGSAMMEPDVRIKTNEMGFCHHHYGQMLGQRNRLAVALILDSHLKELEKKCFGSEKSLLRAPTGQRLYKTARMNETCFICDRMEWGMSRMVRNLMDLYEQDRDFRMLFDSQPGLCMPHYHLLAESALQTLSKRWRGEFQKSAERLALTTLRNLHTDVRHFCDMFDYRNNKEDADWGTSRDAIERSVHFLTGRTP